ASQFEMGPFAAVALPPLPEELPGEARVRSLAEMRDDDLLDGGTIPSEGPASSLPRIQEIVQWYGSLYEHAVSGQRDEEPEQIPSAIDADEIMYSVLGDRERLTELSKLVG